MPHRRPPGSSADRGSSACPVQNPLEACRRHSRHSKRARRAVGSKHQTKRVYQKTHLRHAPSFWRFRFILYPSHTPSSGDSGSSYIVNTPPYVAIPAHPISQHTPPSCGDSGSSRISNTPPRLAIPVHHVSQTRPLIWPHLAIPVHHVSQTRPLFWRFWCITYLKHAP